MRDYFFLHLMAAAFYRNWKVLILIKATHFSSEDAFIGFKDIAGSIVSTLKWIFLVDLIQFIKVGQDSLFTFTVQKYFDSNSCSWVFKLSWDHEHFPTELENHFFGIQWNISRRKPS